MNAQAIEHYADHDLRHNYRALEMASEQDITVEMALIAVALKGYHFVPESTSKRHAFSLQDAQGMAKMREAQMTYAEVGEQYGCEGSHVYITLKKHGLLELGLTHRGGRYRDRKAGGKWLNATSAGARSREARHT